MRDNENDKIEEIKTYISSLSDTEEELKILLNDIINFNSDEENLKFNIVGNKYVKSILNDMELNNKSNTPDFFEDKANNEPTLVLDTDSFTKENIDYFISIVWKQVEDSDYPETNLKKDFDKAFKLIEEESFTVGANCYISFREASLHDKTDVDELKKAKLLKKDMVSKVFAYEYDSLDEFEQISQNNIKGFSDNLMFDKEALNEFIKVINPEAKEKDMLSIFKSIKSYDNIIALFMEDGFEEFIMEFEEKIRGDYNPFEDIFIYVEKTYDELINLNNAIEEEHKLRMDNPEYIFESNSCNDLIFNSTKTLNNLSNEYERGKKEHSEFRSKAFALLLFYTKLSDYGEEDLLKIIVQSNNHFEEIAEFIENHLGMFIDFTDSFPVDDDENYGKIVKILLKEYNRILNNLKSIKTEMNNLNKSLS